jgi:hypothetical protein
MGNQNQGQNQGDNRQTQGGAGQRTNPQDPTLNPERDDENRVQRRTSDEGQGRDRSASGTSSDESGDDESSTTGQSGSSKSGAADQGQTGRRGGNP